MLCYKAHCFNNECLPLLPDFRLFSLFLSEIETATTKFTHTTHNL